MTSKKTETPSRTASYTSVYLDEETRLSLAKLAAVSGTSRSQVVSGLIRRAASNDTNVRVVELVAELSKLVGFSR
jgi:hypothetical protein